MRRSLGGFKCKLFGHNKTTRNDVLEDISESSTNCLDAKRVKDLRIIVISYVFSLSRFHLTIKFRFQR